MAENFLQELSGVAGLSYYRVKITLGSKKEGPLDLGVQTTSEGVLIGHRSGYLVAVGLVRAGWSKSFAVLVRFPAVVDPEALKAAVKKSPQLKRLSAARMVGPETLIYQVPWPFRFTGAKASAMIDAVISVVSQFASTFKPDACEKCGGTAGVVLANHVPAMLCSGCQSSLAIEQQRKRAEYESVEPDYVRGVLAAAAAVVLYTLVWGVGGYLLNRALNGLPVKLLAVIPIIAAVLVAKLYAMGARRITSAGMIVTVALTAVALIAGDAVFYALQIVQEYSVPLATTLRVTLRHLWEIKTDGFYQWLVTAMDGVAVVCSAPMLWGMRPKFKAEFEVLHHEAPDLAVTHVGMAR